VHQPMKPQQWHPAIRSYVLLAAGLNFLWELAQLPFYTIWHDGTWLAIAFAVLHCTAGDLVIAITTLVLCLVMFGSSDWPKQQFFKIGVCVVIAGLAYTIFSERINIANGAWAYSDLMSVIPWLDIGLAPLLQWLLIPIACLGRIHRLSSQAS
jgi:hypothetical protein